jgi:hypothetical protein
MNNKASFCAFYAKFCTFSASLRPTKTVFSWLIRSLPTYQVGQRNPWLIKDLRLCKALYGCRDTFTDVMSALQIHLFMQNKPNFRKSQMNVSSLLTKDYDKKDTWWSGKNKPNSNPIQSQFKANTKPIKANSNPIQTQFQSQYMLLRLTISNSLKSLGYYADEIEAPNAYYRPAGKYPGRFNNYKYVNLEKLKNLTNCRISALM